MQLRSPAEFYVKYLFLHPDAYSVEEVVYRLEELGLDVIDTDYLLRVQSKLRPPKVFYPFNAMHGRSKAYLFKEGVDRAFSPDGDMRAALAIVNTPRAKEFAESLLLGGTPRDYVATLIAKTKKISCTAETLKLYEHYFWNTELLDSSQLRVLLQLRYKHLNGHTGTANTKMLERAYYQDPRRVAADLPSSPTTSMLTQMRMGLLPGKVDIGMQALEARRLAILRGTEALYRDGPSDSMKALNYIQSARVLTELLEFVVKPDQNLQEQLAAVTLRTDTKALPSIHGLSAGKHTVEMVPTKDPNDNQEANSATSDGDD